MDKAASEANVSTVDLRALVFAGLAVAPLWFAVLVVTDSLSNRLIPPETAPAYYVLTIGSALIQAVGGAVVALGIALSFQNGHSFEPSSFVVGALGVAILFASIHAFGFVSLRTYPEELPENYHAPSRQGLMAIIALMSTCQVVSVGLASQLYLRWRSATPDAEDGRRAAALARIAAVFVAFALLSQIATLVHRYIFYPDMIFGRLFEWPWVELIASSAIGHAAALFLFGWLAIAMLRRTSSEHNAVHAITAAVGAAAAYFVVHELPFIILKLQSVEWGARRWIDVLWPLVTTLVVGAGCGIAYVYMIAPKGTLRAGAASAVRALRTWPQRPDDEGHR
jgi:hypothetical protein